MQGEIGKETTTLQRSLWEVVRLDWWRIALVIILLVGIATRLWDLGGRSYDHDESIHAWESWKLATGQGYIHNPIYHGPFGYHFTALLFLIFGITDFTGRLGAGVFSIALLFIPLLFRKQLGRMGTLVACALLVISPVLMHRGRFFRHDPFLLVFGLLLIYAIFQYLDKPRDKYIYLAAASFALAFCSKEVVFIYGLIIGSFLGLLLLYRWSRARGRSLVSFPEFDMALLLFTLVLPSLSPFAMKVLGIDPMQHDWAQIMNLQSGAWRPVLLNLLVFLAFVVASAVIGIWWKRRQWLASAGIYWGICITLFTTMFTNGQGIATGMIGSLAYWLSQQPVQRGGQPWFYYLLLMPLYEFLPMLFATIGTFAYAVNATRGRQESEMEPKRRLRAPVEESALGGGTIAFVPFLIYWTWMSVALFSWAGEKMPWLMQHLSVPFIFLAAWYIGRVLENTDWQAMRERGGLIFTALLPLAIFTFVILLVARPFRGTSLMELGETSRWLLALLIFVGTAYVLYLIGRRLGRANVFRGAFIVTLVLLGLCTMRFAWMASFKNANYATEFLVYAAATPDTRRVMDELEDMQARLQLGENLKVAYDDESSWPFVWYLRDYKNAQFFGKQPAGPLDADVVIVGPGNEPGVKPYLGDNYLRRDYRLIWWPIEDYKGLTLRKIIEYARDPAKRQSAWNIIWNRKYETPVSSWTYVHTFAMYVRKDLAVRLWDYGPEVATGEIKLPGEEYDQKWVSIAAARVIGSPGSAPGQLMYPKGLDIGPDGNIYVADSQNHRVQVFKPNGEFVRVIGQGQGNAPGQFQEPWGLAVDDEGYVYVADTWNHRIQVFDADGKFVRQWGVFGDMTSSGGIVFYGPRDIVIGKDGNLYVSDTGNKRVLKFDRKGNSLGQFGGAGALSGQFQEPVGLAVDTDGNFYVADTWNQRIQKFDQNFAYLTEWSVYGWESQSVVNKPYLATDPEGNVCCTIPESHRIARFSPTGQLLTVWGQYGADATSLNMPTGIAIDAVGNIYVSDSENHRLMVFSAMK
ncbi:MAG: TIGR03663 family protein [Chloroflexi bacterium]|nr:TIGR03663 family protein [Chloroflexota bacterium]